MRNLTVLFLLLLAFLAELSFAKVRIMPLGDSITKGTGTCQEPDTYLNCTGYRSYLWNRLAEAGYSVDFVGSQGGEFQYLHDHDNDHEGHGGWRDDQIAANIFGWLKGTPADIVLLHIGTNSPDPDPGQVEDILDEIDRFSEDIVVVLALIIKKASAEDTVMDFNDNIEMMAYDRIAAGDKIHIVDMENALTYWDDIYDGTHPNEGGYQKMADVWFQELSRLLYVTAPVPQAVDWGGSVTFTVSAMNAVSYEWYKSPDATNNTPAGDQQIGSASSSISISNVQSTDEAYYYCIVSDGVDSIASPAAHLSTKRLIANWGFDGDLTDSGGGHDGSRVNTAIYDTGIIGTSALLIDGDADDVVTIPYSPELNTESYTFSVWVKVPTGASGTSVGMYSNRDAVAQGGSIAYYQSTTKWVARVRSSSGFESSVTTVSTTEEGDWLLFVCTFERTGGFEGILSVYMDGKLEAQDRSAIYNPNTSFETVIGSLWSSASGYYGPFTGFIDDVKWYNYALTEKAVAQAYVDVMGGSICTTQPAFDTNDDCVVDWADFAEFAGHWLENNLVNPSN